MSENKDKKILRIGLIQNGKIVEERLLRKREPITIGQSPRNTFVLSSAGLPKTYSLFEMKGTSYFLNFRAGMNGKISVEDSVLDFRALREQKLARKKGENYILKLSERSRGKVMFGEVTVLFQFVEPPPPPSKLQLPASMRGGAIGGGMELPFLYCLLGSFVVQVFSTAFIVTRDYPEETQSLDKLPDRFVGVLLEDKPPPPPPKKIKVEEKEEVDDDAPVDKTVEKEAAEPEPEPEPEPKAEPKSAEEKAREKAKKIEEFQEKVASKTILKFVGAVGADGESGSLIDSLKEGASSVALKDAFIGDGLTAAKDSSTKRLSRTSGKSGKVAGLDDSALKGRKAGKVKSGKKGKEVAVKGRMKLKKPSEAFGTGVLSPNAITKVVKRRAGAVKSCYERQLKRNPKLKGKVVVQFEILQSGRVGKTKIVKNTTRDPAVGDCIKKQVKRWRFPKPDGGSVTVSFPFLFAPSG